MLRQKGYRVLIPTASRYGLATATEALTFTAPSGTGSFFGGLPLRVQAEPIFKNLKLETGGPCDCAIRVTTM